MIIPRLLECLEVPNIFLEVAEAQSWSVCSDKDNKSHIHQPDFKTYIVVKSNVIPRKHFWYQALQTQEYLSMSWVAGHLSMESENEILL